MARTSGEHAERQDASQTGAGPQDAGRVLLLNAAVRHGIVALRSLGRRGVEVTVEDSGRIDGASASKYAAGSVALPPPDETTAFVDAVAAELDRRDYDAVIALHPGTIEVLVDAADRLEPHAGLPFPSADVLRAGTDKTVAIDVARRAGVPHPATLAADEVDLDHDLGRVRSELGYPVVVKPRRGSEGRGVEVCRSPGALQQVVPAMREQYGPLLLQEWIPDGGECSAGLLYDLESEPRAAMVERKLRRRSATGPPTRRESVAEPVAVEHGERILTALDWRGVASVDFRRDPRDGRLKFLEINPHLWSSVGLAIRAGIDVPYLLYRIAVAGSCEPHFTYETGVCSRWLFGDLLGVVEGRGRALREVLTDGCRNFDVVSRDDPLSAVGYVVDGVRSRV